LFREKEKKINVDVTSSNLESKPRANFQGTAGDVVHVAEATAVQPPNCSKTMSSHYWFFLGASKKKYLLAARLK
jgi:hypothetical protein